MTVVVNSHIRKAVCNARAVADNGSEESLGGSATQQLEYGDDEAVAAIYGSVEMREAYRALLADAALPAVFECDGARTRQVDSLLLHLERLGWYNPLNDPFADATTRDVAVEKLQAMLRALLPVESSPDVAHRWLLQPSRTLVVLTQILRRILYDGDILVTAQTQEALLGTSCSHLQCPDYTS